MKKWNYRDSLAFLALLPLFFLFHNYVDFYPIVSLNAILLSALLYLTVAVLLTFIFKLLLRSSRKASLFVFLLLTLEFFYGALQDTIRNAFADSFLNRYSFQLSLIGLFFLSCFFYLRRKNFDPGKAIRFLNTLLPLLILIDLVQWGIKIKKTGGNETANRLLITNGNNSSPDIYFILADGYSGSTALNKYFNYDNSGFENALRSRGFYVADSSFSNYNFTIFSVASYLNLDQLPVRVFFEGYKDLPLAFQTIRKNQTAAFLGKKGYDIFNYSIFDLDKFPTPLTKTLLKFDKSPLYSQTFSFRVLRDLGYHLSVFTGTKKTNPEDLFTDLNNNVLADSLTRKASQADNSKPKFVYTHLLMPHWPYYFDSMGNRVSIEHLKEEAHGDPARYISYLKYANKKLLSLADEIRATNKRPFVMVIISDHGCRDRISLEGTGNDQCLNLAAVYLPDSNYSGFYKGITGINFMRLVMNKTFGQQLPLIKDSSTLISADENLLR